MEFVKFKRAVHAQFNQLAAGADMLFLTNVDKDALWDCYPYYYVTGINYGYSDSETMLNNLKKYIESHNHIVIGPDIEGTLRLSSIINKNPGLPADVKAFSYPNIVSFDSVKISKNELFVACPPGQLNNPEVTITKKAVDPIVYQPCAYGILIHSMWGEESEDKVFEEYKRINNLML